MTVSPFRDIRRKAMFPSPGFPESRNETGKRLGKQLIVCGKAYRVLRLLRHVKGGNIDSPRRTDLDSQY